MSRPLEDLGLMHRPLQVLAASQPVPGPREGLLEAYKKHVEELRGIEDRQNKTIALLLGVFSAAATLLAKGGLSLPIAPKIYLSAMALVIVFIGHHAIRELHDMRIAARDLLVRCECGLGFYEVGAFLDGKRSTQRMNCSIRSEGRG